MSLIDGSYSLIFQPRRAIGTIYPHVVVEEVHQDALGITQHPVETGATVTDHSFKMPSRVDMLCGWSDSTAGIEGYIRDVYQALLALQASREPINVYTGKRLYRNMLVQGLVTQTDEKTASVLMVRASLQEIIITRTRTSGGSGGGGNASPDGGGTGSGAGAPNRDQADPASTGGTTDGGTQQLAILDQSYLNANQFSRIETALPSEFLPTTSGVDLTSSTPTISSNATLFGQFVPSF